MTQVTEQAPETKKNKHILGWIFGIIFLLMAIMQAFSSILSGFFMFLLGVLILPETRQWLETKLKRKISRVAALALGTCLFLVSMGILGSANKPDTTSIASSTNTADTATAANANTAPTLTPEEQTAQEAAEKARQEALAKPHFSDGNWIVGTDIQPGTYRTRQASSGCYFERQSGFSSSFDDIIANDNTDAPTVVTIAETDKGFKSSRCGTWTQDLSAITTDKTSFSDGTYIVGTDIEPGTYRSTASDGCYYARLSGFSGSFDDLIANEITDAAAIVTISPSDEGFKSSRCGTWTKI